MADSSRFKGKQNEKDGGTNLVNTFIQPFMSETDPRNPYGCNYEELDYEQKVFAKYAEVKKYVHFSSEDNSKVLKANIMYIGSIAFSMIGFLSVGYLLKSRQLLKRIRSLHIFAEEHTKFYYGAFVASSGSLSYFYFNKLYIQSLCKPLMMKYLEEAKAHGFQDYVISETKPFDIQEKFFGPSRLKKQ